MPGILQPLVVVLFVSVLKESISLCRLLLGIRFFLGVILFGVSLLTLTTVSVERLLALLLGLQFRQVVTLKRTLQLEFLFGSLILPSPHCVFGITLFFFGMVLFYN